MIVKVKNEKESWSYFECDIIHSKYQLLKDVTFPFGSCVVLFEKQPDNPGESLLNVKILNLETQKSHLRTILTDRPCYILNNEGKTIDRI